MALPLVSSRPPAVSLKDYRVRPLKRGDKDALFKLLAADGWIVPQSEQETVLSWVVQHPEIESFVAHHAISYGSVFAVLSLSHRPQLRLGGRLGCIDLFAVEAGYRGNGVGSDLLAQALRRGEALGCKRFELRLPGPRDYRHEFFEEHGFSQSGDALYVRRLNPLG
ncbi:MAG TPA: GNAT family N-acetyltransferase [Myxococcales bacterium]|nr:GNAT family N-acetyltransferase [Myxococcales bacterium]